MSWNVVVVNVLRADVVVGFPYGHRSGLVVLNGSAVDRLSSLSGGYSGERPSLASLGLHPLDPRGEVRAAPSIETKKKPLAIKDGQRLLVF